MSHESSGSSGLSGIGRVHMIAIGGAGMSVVARLLQERGVPVQGSDARDSAVLHDLSRAGVTTWVGHDGAQVAGADTVVVSSAVRADNVELLAARAAGLRVLHRSEMLARLMSDTVAVAVAGAHGKTTTSAMLTVALTELGVDPSCAIGADLLTSQGRTSGARTGTGPVMVVEADESDGSFLAYAPSVAVVTNVEPDHLDHYRTREAFEQAFAEFVARIRPGGALVTCADDPGAARLAARARESGGRVLTYGTSRAADLRVEPHETVPGRASATLHVPATMALPDGPFLASQVVPAHSVPLLLSVPGLHNLLDAAAAVGVLTLLGAEPVTAAQALARFMGTGRRYEHRGTVAGVRVIDDYAHHPTEVAAALAAAREQAVPGAVRVLFQPHLFSRTARFATEFAAALAAADDAVVCDVYAAREDPVAGVGPETIVTQAPAGASLTVVHDRDAAARALADRARPGDIVLTMGAGDVTETAQVVLDRLTERFGGGPE